MARFGRLMLICPAAELRDSRHEPDAEIPEAPATLTVSDYAENEGQGDQARFLRVAWSLSPDHDSLSNYRLYREMRFSK